METACDLCEKWNKETVIKWFIHNYFSCQKPLEHAILLSKVERLRGFLREIEADTARAKKLLEDYWNETKS